MENKKTFYIDSFCFSGFAVEKLRALQAVIRQQKLPAVSDGAAAALAACRLLDAQQGISG